MRVPRVGNQPVLLTSLNTKADDLDGVSTDSFTSSVLVNTALVSQKVFVDSEGNLDRAVSVDLLQNVLLAGQRVSSAALVQVLAVSQTVLAATNVAVGSVVFLRRARVLGSGNVVIAAGERIRLALFGDDTSLGPVLPSSRGETTTAAITAAIAASKQVVRADGQVGLLQEDAITIRHGLDGSKSPAASASGLIANLLNSIALGPLLARIEVSGEVLDSSVSIGLARKLRTALESTDVSAGFTVGDALHASLVEGGSPR